ncbi:MAG: hypothetical protein ACYDBQ_02795 [Thermoplasmatota archaeon]
MASSKLLGIILIVLGALLLLGWLHVAHLMTILGVVLLVVGLLVLLGHLHGARWLGILCVILGILVLFPDLPVVGNLVDAVGTLLTTIIGVVLIVVGALKLANKA